MNLQKHLLSALAMFISIIIGGAIFISLAYSIPYLFNINQWPEFIRFSVIFLIMFSSTTVSYLFYDKCLDRIWKD
jgi:hypothetical protein